MFLRKKFLILAILFNFSIPLQANSSHNISYIATYIEAIAKSMLGMTYQWGGNGPYKYDCSGFTKEVFEENGIDIPRNSWNQAKVGKKIRKNQLKKGDLVFFTSKNHTDVNHVGIYLGKGKFIHASRFHKRIVISPLREYRRFFKWGCRLT